MIMKKLNKVSSNKVMPVSVGSASSSIANIKTSTVSTVPTPAADVRKANAAAAAVRKTAKVTPAAAATKGKVSTVTKPATKKAESSGAKKSAATSVPMALAASAAVPPLEPAPDPNKGINGEVTICYNHYKKKFPIVDASTTQTVIDEEYYLTFAFPNSKLHLSVHGPSDFSYEDQGLTERPFIAENPEGTYVGLVPDAVYWVHIEEDSAEKEAYEKRSEEFSKAQKAKRDAEEEAEKNGLTQLVIEKKESCSCIEGNPCLDKYCCKDWTNRFEVAKRNGWKGFS